MTPPLQVSGDVDTQTALAQYSRSLHKFTQELWLEARRKAELEAQGNTRGLRRTLKKDPKRGGSPEQARRSSPVRP